MNGISCCFRMTKFVIVVHYYKNIVITYERDYAMSDETGLLNLIRKISTNSVKDIYKLAVDCIENNVSVAFFLFKESKPDFIKSVLSEMIGKDIETVSDNDDWDVLVDAMAKISNSDIYFYDSKDKYSLDDVYDKIYQLKYGSKQGLQFVVYDFELEFVDESEENLLARKAIALDVGIIYKNSDGVFSFVKSTLKNDSLWLDKKTKINDIIQNYDKMK